MDNIIFVSLGSTCEISHILKNNQLRKQAFPFDWITTIDSEKFIKLIQEDFKYFLDRKYLISTGKDPFPLLNTYYNIEFLHDGVFNNELFDINMQKFQEKYMRRINRFRDLSGKVVFLRHSYKYSMTDPHRVYKCEDNLNISDDFAIKLYNVIANYFNKLDFTLICVNNHDKNELSEYKKINDNLILIDSNTALDLDIKSDLYKKYLKDIFNAQ
jgi:hypothetical protein